MGIGLVDSSGAALRFVGAGMVWASTNGGRDTGNRASAEVVAGDSTADVGGGVGSS
jgi:hypothetical protein